MVRRLAFLLLGSPLVVSAACQPSQAAAAAPANSPGVQLPAPAPSLKVTTRMVVVDVIATDRKGL
ncbi:MAG TPA: hypothetical protein VE783_11090, partial [Candidatus Limnocylindrales bacterium]|nr:hypothetical protein [Candidatus Limnocylindrales bacterium]